MNMILIIIGILICIFLFLSLVVYLFVIYTGYKIKQKGEKYFKENAEKKLSRFQEKLEMRINQNINKK